MEVADRSAMRLLLNKSHWERIHGESTGDGQGVGNQGVSGCGPLGAADRGGIVGHPVIRPMAEYREFLRNVLQRD